MNTSYDPTLASSQTHAIAELLNVFRAGQINREAFWIAMRDHHRSLLGHQQLVGKEDVAGIDIRADGLWVVFNGGLRMWWDPELLRSVPSVSVNHGSYEPTERQLLTAFASRSHMVLDVGSNEGFMALAMGQVVHRHGGRIHAFEPLPQTAETLRANVNANGLTDVVKCHSLALGQSNEMIDIFVPDIHGSVAASSRPLFQEFSQTRFTVPMRRLDDLRSELAWPRVDLVKIDVEGSELFVLRGAIETLRQDRPVLMVEILRKWTARHDYAPDDILALMSGLGYRCFSHEPGLWRPVTKIDAACEQTNFFFAMPDHQAWMDEVLAAVSR